MDRGVPQVLVRGCSQGGVDGGDCLVGLVTGGDQKRLWISKMSGPRPHKGSLYPEYKKKERESL